MEVKEHGQTKIMLTADSNMIEVHDLKKSYHQPKNIPVKGRGRGKDTLTRFLEKEAPIHVPSNPPSPDQEQPHDEIDGLVWFGHGWFMWKDWKVQESFMEKFNSHISNLVLKHRKQLMQQQLKVRTNINVTVTGFPKNVPLGHGPNPNVR